MSGHNKWSKIKNVQEKNDQQNAKMYTKIGREIAVAVKLNLCFFNKIRIQISKSNS